MVADYARPLLVVADGPRVIFAPDAARNDYRDARRFVIRVVPEREQSRSCPSDAPR